MIFNNKKKKILKLIDVELMNDKCCLDDIMDTNGNQINSLNEKSIAYYKNRIEKLEWLKSQVEIIFGD